MLILFLNSTVHIVLCLWRELQTMLYGLYRVISGSLRHFHSEGLAKLTVQYTLVIETMGLWESAVYLCPEKGLPELPLHEWRGYSEEGHNNTGMLWDYSPRLNLFTYNCHTCPSHHTSHPRIYADMYSAYK